VKFKKLGFIAPLRWICYKQCYRQVHQNIGRNSCMDRY